MVARVDYEGSSPSKTTKKVEITKGLENKSVMLTSVELGGVGWFTSIISKIHKDMFGKPISWNYEVSRFEATRVRRPLPRGWCTVWNARPEDLVKRDYYRVIGLQKSLEDVYYSHALYHRPEMTYDEILDKEPWFFNEAKEKWLRMEKPFEHENYMRFHLDDLNTYTVEFFSKALDFLGFPNEERPTNARLFAIVLKAWFEEHNSWEHLAQKLIDLISQFRTHLLPVKAYRNWECYSNVSLKKGHVLKGNLKKIKEMYYEEVLNKVCK